MRRSILVAGMNDEENQYTRFCTDAWFDWEHMAEVRAGHVPTKHDAVIVAAAIASHSLYQSVKAAYNQMGKPLFLSKVGISEIREDFDLWMFGDKATIAKLKQLPGNGEPAMPVTSRFGWLLANFLNVGDQVKLKDIQRFFDKFMNIGLEKAVAQAWYKARENGMLTELSAGKCVFNGIPETLYQAIQLHGLTCPKENVMEAVKSTKSKFKEAHFPSYVVECEAEKEEIQEQPETKKHSVDDHSATTDLLLEAISRSQDEVRALREMIERTVPEIIQREMRVVTVLLGSLVPKLQGLSPDQVVKVDQMLDLFLSMRS